MKRSLRVETADTIKVTDKLHTFRRWFNGAKHFFTVKVLPKRRE